MTSPPHRGTHTRQPFHPDGAPRVQKRTRPHRLFSRQAAAAFRSCGPPLHTHSASASMARCAGPPMAAAGPARPRTRRKLRPDLLQTDPCKLCKDPGVAPLPCPQQKSRQHFQAAAELRAGHNRCRVALRRTGFSEGVGNTLGITPLGRHTEYFRFILCTLATETRNCLLDR